MQSVVLLNKRNCPETACLYSGKQKEGRERASPSEETISRHCTDDTENRADADRPKRDVGLFRWGEMAEELIRCSDRERENGN
jgi:hypothetical protein